MLRKKKKRLQRKALIKRKTQEVKIKGKFVIDGRGRSHIDSGIKFLDHMLTLFAFHGFFDLDLQAEGDLGHHTVEDIGIALGEALNQAIGEARGIRRYGLGYVPMDEVLVRVVVDISGRANLSMSQTLDKRQIVPELPPPVQGEAFGFQDVEKFLKAFVERSRANIHLDYKFEKDTHHLLEAIFKGLGIAMDQATQLEPRRKGVPSTKTTLDL